MDGILNINKPAGPTSFDIISLVRRLSGEKRVGHTGTLDPLATGVLPVCLGKGTRIIEFLVDTTKTYRAEIELGVSTDTYDAEGRVTGTGDYSAISREQVEEALSSLGEQTEQVPPAYSALKYKGKPLYKWAREGIDIEPESRPVRIHQIQLRDWETPLVSAEIVCGKGTYIRSLAHDLGQLLGCGAHLKSLVRLRCGIFDISEAVRVPELEEAFRQGNQEQFIYPLDSVLSHWKAVVVNDDRGREIVNGRPVRLEDNLFTPGGTGNEQTALNNASGQYCRAYNEEGHFLAVLRRDPEKGHWQPHKVFL